MGTLRNTDWPTKFGQPDKAGVAINYHQDLILSNGFEVNTQRLNPIKNPIELDLVWTMQSFGGFDCFSTFEGWYRHNIWRGLRGCNMDIEIAGTTRPFTVFFTRGYTATCLDFTTALYQVSARVDAVEL